MDKLPGSIILGVLLAFCTGIGSAADMDKKSDETSNTTTTKPLKQDQSEARKNLRQHSSRVKRPNRAAVINERRANRAGN